MTDYLNFTDLKTILISLITAIVGFFICVGIQRYWTNHSIKSMRRRIEESEAHKTKLNNLAKSDRALLIFGFQGILVMVVIINIVVVVQVIFVGTIRAGRLNYLEIALVLLLLLPAILGAALIKMLRDVSEYPGSIENIEKRITELKSKLLDHGSEK
jgi:hypothetical protein